MIILSGSSHTHLSQALAKNLNATLGDVELSTFTNGEKRVRVLSPVHNEEVVIVQSFVQAVDSSIIELVLIADACERAGAKQVTAVIPWLGYSLQDKVFREGEPLAARVIADIVSNAFIQKVVLLDVHNTSIAGFFSVPTLHLRALPLFVSHIQKQFDMANCITVSPDFGGLKAARLFAQQLGTDLVNVNKHRDLVTGEVTTVDLAGDVNGKICLVYDDVINTGGTVVEVAKFLKENGAKEVHFCVTHGLFAGEGLEKMSDPSIDSVMISDSIEHAELPDKIKVVSVAKLIAEVIQ